MVPRRAAGSLRARYAVGGASPARFRPRGGSAWNRSPPTPSSSESSSALPRVRGWFAAPASCRRARALVVVLGFGLLFRALMLPTPVYLSSDLYRYLWDGRVQLAGGSPYRYAPAAPELARLRDSGSTRISTGRRLGRLPAGAQWLFALAAAGGDPDPCRRGVPSAPRFEVATVAILVLLLSAPARAAGDGSDHVRVVAARRLRGGPGWPRGPPWLSVVLLALLLRQAGSSVLAGAALGVAVLMKLYPVVLCSCGGEAIVACPPGGAAMTGGSQSTTAAGRRHWLSRRTCATLGIGALGFLPEYLSSPEEHNIGLRALLTRASA